LTNDLKPDRYCINTIELLYSWFWNSGKNVCNDLHSNRRCTLYKHQSERNGKV